MRVDGDGLARVLVRDVLQRLRRRQRLPALVVPVQPHARRLRVRALRVRVRVGVRVRVRARVRVRVRVRVEWTTWAYGHIYVGCVRACRTPVSHGIDGG